jgi:glycerol-3-phosphate dehydrogenase
MMERRPSLAGLHGSHFDVVVIGSGINGAAGAQSLVARGYKVLLAEKGDFGSGSSSRSSRLLHCGLRYLAPGRSPWEFVLQPKRFAISLKMARHAVIARDEFLKTTPNRTQRIKLYFPIYKDSQYSGWQIDAAFGIMNRFNRGRTPLDYARVGPEEARKIPLVRNLGNFEGLESVATYAEYQVAWPERVTVDLVMDAKAGGAMVRNYVEASIKERRGDKWVIELRDVSDGSTGTVTASSVVTTGGIWIDRILGPHRTGKLPKVLATKGTHIAVRLPPECKGYGIATLNRKNQPLYCLPWGDYHYIGPTETLYEGDLDRIRPSEEERQWLLGEINHLLPGLNLQRHDIAYSWSGVRPLTWDANQPMGSRNRVLHDLSGEGLDNVFALTGGPVMTHRSAGEEIARAVSARISPSGMPRLPSYSSRFPSPLETEMLRDLTSAEPPEWVRQMPVAEDVVHLSDVVLRRTGLAWYEKMSPQKIAAIGNAFGTRMGWDEEKTRQEIAAAIDEVALLQD